MRYIFIRVGAKVKRRKVVTQNLLALSELDQYCDTRDYYSPFFSILHKTAIYFLVGHIRKAIKKQNSIFLPSNLSPSQLLPDLSR